MKIKIPDNNRRPANPQYAHKLARIQATTPYITDLRKRIGLYLGWIPNEYADQAAADSAYNLLKNDSEIGRCLHLHACMCAGEKFRIKIKRKEDEDLKEILEKLLSFTSDFMHARKSLIENGILFGLGIQRKKYAHVNFRKYRGYTWTAINSIEEVDVRRLRIERDPEFRDLTYWTIYNPIEDKYIKILDRHDYPEQIDGDAVQDYVWYFHEREETNPYFRGVGAALYPLIYGKVAVMQYWRELCESWAKPWMVAKMDLLRGAISALLGDDFKTYSDRVTDWLDVMDKSRARHAIVMDKNDNLEVMEHGTTGNNICREFISYVDEKIALCLLGAELTTGTGSGVGSFALGNVHRQQTETLIMYSRARLEQIILTDIVNDLLYRNRWNFYALGFDPPEPGEIEIELYIDAEEKKEAAMEKNLSGYRGDPQKIV